MQLRREMGGTYLTLLVTLRHVGHRIFAEKFSQLV